MGWEGKDQGSEEEREGGEKRERESENEMMNNAHRHKGKNRIRKCVLDLATRSPVVA